MLQSFCLVVVYSYLSLTEQREEFLFSIPERWLEENDGRSVHKHPAEGKYCRCYPGYFCFLIMSFPSSLLSLQEKETEQASEVRLFEDFPPITGVIQVSSSIAGDCFCILYFAYSLHISILPLHLIRWKLQIISKSRVVLFQVSVRENRLQII